MESLPHFIGMVLVVAILFFFLVAGNCTMLATVAANSYTENPPGVFQFAEGWECTKDVWRFYLGLGE